MAQMGMNFFQQYSQMMLLNSLVAAGGKSPIDFNPSIFGTPSSPSPVSPKQESEHSITQEDLMASITALANISNILAASSTIKNEVFPSTSYSPSKASTPAKHHWATSSPQREYKVAVNHESAKPLQDWMMANLQHPYPTSQEVKQLAQETGFTNKQIRNWFTNSRRRYEMKAGNSPLPWTKKDAPKYALAQRRSSTPSSPQSQITTEVSPLESPKIEVDENVAVNWFELPSMKSPKAEIIENEVDGL